MKKVISLVMVITMLVIMAGCGESTFAYAETTDVQKQEEVQRELTNSQSTPTDISYSLERYNLIKRAYWVNGQREKANTLPCAVDKPLGYIVMFTESGAVIGSFIVDGKISSLNSFLTPNYIEDTYGSSTNGSGWTTVNTELADVDGSFGENDNGIFFFTPDGKYIEWTGIYLYSDIPFIVEDPVVKVGS